MLWLWSASLWVCGSILTVVTGALLYMMIRFRRRDGREPSQVTGNRNLEVAWTVIPILLVATLFVLGIVAARAVDRPIGRAPDVIVTGHQWWWEVRYPSANVITANEVHLPLDRDMLIEVDTADVIHDFWVPELGRKIDAIPGRRNFVWIHADRLGSYRGACAEYCGAQHAWMRFRVDVEELPVYQAWLAAQMRPAAQPSGEAARQGETRFGQLTCVNCHNIRGVHAQKPYAPDLTHLASRAMLAGERLSNSRANLRDWLHQPNIIKPDCLMPNLKLSDADLTSLTAYLEDLR